MIIPDSVLVVYLKIKNYNDTNWQSYKTKRLLKITQFLSIRQ